MLDEQMVNWNVHLERGPSLYSCKMCEFVSRLSWQAAATGQGMNTGEANLYISNISYIYSE